MSEQYFHLTIGPVQAFVAQARRTRDFWAGSFILSYLSSVAMAAVRQQQGSIEFPQPDENYLSWLEGEGGEVGSEPIQGSVPNRFKAVEAKVSQDFKPEAVTAAVQQAWQALSHLVWQYDLLPVVGTESAQADIWQRQINNFWEVSWCLTEEQHVANLLDRRKNWRSHVIADEPGVKCSLMEGYQELSGAERPGQDVNDFWQKVRALDVSLARDLREDEYLSAIALVKRRFVHYFKELDFTLPTVGEYAEKTLRGWKVPKTVPSVAYLAAAPWLAKSIELSSENMELYVAIKALGVALSDLDVAWEGTVLKNIKDACSKVERENWRWSQVNGQYLFAPALQQYLKDAKRDSSLLGKDVSALQEVQKQLRIMQKISALGEPSPFYAILLMDGDSLGKQMSSPKKQVGISQGLNNFTRGVPAIVQKHSGFLVYAGGDDVLALLPQPFAIACASEVREFYDQCFAAINETQPQNEKIVTSISGAIEFGHYKTPLTRLLQDSHQLLDAVAKETTGRNSLAIRVWKPGGLFAQWSAPWSGVAQLQNTAQVVAQHLQGDLSRSFFFKLESLIQELGLSDTEKHGFSDEVIYSLVSAAWVHTGNKLEKLPSNMGITLLEACREVRRITDDTINESKEEKTSRFMPGALRLLQFLATENQRFLLPITTGVDTRGEGL